MNATAEVVSISERLSQREASDPIEQALNSLSFGKRVLNLRKNQVVFSQGEPADALYYILRGQVKLVVVSFTGKEATLSVMGKRDFFGLGSLQQRSQRLPTATTLEPSVVVRIERDVMLRELRNHPRLYEMLLTQLLNRTLTLQKDLCTHIFDPSEKRLARVLLKLSRLGEIRQEQVMIPKISHDTLATMVGTTRSRITYFMNKFKKLGFIDYGKAMMIHPTRLTTAIQED
ncbi:MAG: Crp/Fnr family transcriptional regulator [Acidobacteria bacterium]|nr:Crp/Fnr family transcriptional regulator [Acidobacteriota bacterium]MCI0719727.1 Crp/Fnr family transcriptional regulator [Acidobacteriota bacterium]